MLIIPERTHGTVYGRDDIPFGYQGWPSICRTQSGRLISVCSGYRLAHVCPFGKTVMNISDDEGRTWSPPIIINDGPLDDRDAGILSLGGDRLLVTWFVHPAEAMEKTYYESMRGDLSPDEWELARARIGAYKDMSEEARKGGSYIMLSDDGGFSWSRAIRVPVSSPHGPALLNDGRLLYLGKEMYSSGALEKGIIAAYESADGGRNWKLLGKVDEPAGVDKRNMHEPHVLQLPDGSLLGAIRIESVSAFDSFTIYTCRSTDGGRTWSVPEPTGISGSPPHLMLHSSGAVIMSYGRREIPFGERASLSYDGGRTWTDEYDIDSRAAGGDLGYPASVELDNGDIFTLYYQRRPTESGFDKKPSILSTRWRLK